MRDNLISVRRCRELFKENRRVKCLSVIVSKANRKAEFCKITKSISPDLTACNDGVFYHFELSLESEKSTEFKIRLKALKSRFDFVDTSLRSV